MPARWPAKKNTTSRSALIAPGSNTSRRATIPTRGVTSRCCAAIIATMRRASKSARRSRCFAAPTASSTSITSAASAASRACKPVPTTRFTSIPNATPRPSVTSMPRASRWVTSRPAKWSVRPRRFSPAISTIPIARSASASRWKKSACAKPEKGTKPKLFYVGVDGDLLNPTMMEPQATHFWAEKDPGEDLYALKSANPERPIPGAAREVYDVPHVTPWGKKIASYLWTKSISAGVLLLSALFLNMGFEQDAVLLSLISPALSLLFLAATMVLVGFGSKKARAVFLFADQAEFQFMAGVGRLCADDFWPFVGVLAVADLHAGIESSPWVIWPAALFAIASAGYSAFLFAQARGRDFWQSPLLFWHLLVKAVARRRGDVDFDRLVGACDALSFHEPADVRLADQLLVVSLFASLAMIFSELFMKHGAEDAVRAGELLLARAVEQIRFGFVSSVSAPSCRSADSLAHRFADSYCMSSRLFWRCSVSGCTTISGSKPAKLLPLS